MMVVDSSIIKISKKKAKSFPMFAYFFWNTCQFYSKYALSITINVRWWQNLFDKFCMVSSQNIKPYLSSILRKAKIIKYFYLFIYLYIFQSFYIDSAIKAIILIPCLSND